VKKQAPHAFLPHRMVRIGVWTLTMLLSWLWFTTNPSPETCINDGLDGECSPLGDSLSYLLGRERYNGFYSMHPYPNPNHNPNLGRETP
jgi:hypothetical protein